MDDRVLIVPVAAHSVIFILAHRIIRPPPESLSVNRQDWVTLLALAGATLYAIGTTVVVAGAFLAPSATRGLVSETGILVASLAWVVWVLAVIVYRERILAWMRHRSAVGSGP